MGYSLNLYTNTPADTILVNRVYQKVLSPANCANPGTLQIFNSDTLDLGPIPVSGYTISYSGCCRNQGISNLGQIFAGIYVEALMLPEPGQNYASSSPKFVNPLVLQELNNGSFTLNQPAIDPDGDSVFYALTPVQQGEPGNYSAVIYSAGYSGSMPLGTNTPISINQNTGSFTASNVQIGTYAFNVQLKSYKAGQLTSIVNRDFITAALFSSPAVPNISLLNYSGSQLPILNSNGVYEIKVPIGDSVSFDINGTVLVDSIFLSAASILLGTGNNVLGNCRTNCADFNAKPNLFGTASATGRFRFLADSAHLFGGNITTYEIVFLSASQGNCQTMMMANLVINLSVIPNTGIGLPEEKSNSFSVYPNPTQGFFTMENSTSKSCEVRLLSAQGQEIQRFSLLPGKNQFQLEDYAKGLFFLVDEDGHSQQIVVH